MPFEKRYPPEWFYDPEASDKKMELVDVPVQDTWRAMESLIADGLVRNIGVSNFNTQGLRDLMSYAEIKPVVLQVRKYRIAGWLATVLERVKTLHLKNYLYIKMIDPTLISPYLTKNSPKVDILV